MLREVVTWNLVIVLRKSVTPRGAAGAGCRARVCRVRLAAVMPRLAFAQSPGLLVADTKFDLVAAPARFLAARRCTCGTRRRAFGQLQNQAYGYLWPMGPFFLLGSLAARARLGVQRLWWRLVLCVAFLGVVRLARALGVRSDLARVLAGFAYALSPADAHHAGADLRRGMAECRGALGAAAAGHRARSAGRPAGRRPGRRWRSPLVGGVNAAADVRGAPAGRRCGCSPGRPGPRRRTLLVWWPVFTLLGTLWWLVPLFVLGGLQPAVPGLHRVGVEHHVPDHPLRRAARHLELGPVRRPAVPRRATT